MRNWLAAAMVLTLSTFSVHADETADAASVRAVIDRQIAAFRSDDGAAAWSLASPRLREIFPSAEVFMGMVRSGYAPVYRPRSVTFGRLKAVDGGFAQEVFVTGPDGEGYTALYLLETQGDGSLRISGCKLVKASGQAA